MKRNIKNAVATFRGLMAILIAFVVIATPSTVCAKEKNKPTTLGNLGSVNIYRIESVLRENGNGATITYVKLLANGTWSKEVKKSEVPYVQHFKGQYFSGVNAPKGLITLMFFSENDSAACDATLESPDRTGVVQWIRQNLLSSD